MIINKEIKQRIDLLLLELKMNQGELSKRMGFSNGNGLSMITRGKNELRESHLIILENTFKVNRTWLLYGTGEMFTQAHPPPEKPPDIQSLPVYDFTNEQRINLLLVQNAETQRQNDRLLTLLEKQEETIRLNSLTINILSANTNMSKNVEGQAS